MVAHKYRYANPDGSPLVTCPDCDLDLFLPGRVLLELSVADRQVEVRTELTRDGWLVDTEDDAVAKGLHSRTLCGECGFDLLEFEA